MNNKVLFVLGSFEMGGVQNGVMNFAKIINPSIVSFDVLLLTSNIGFYESEFKKYGNIYHMPIMTSKTRLGIPIKLFVNNIFLKYKLNRFFSEHKYLAVHSKDMAYSAVIMECAKKNNVGVRVAQSHVDMPEKLHPILKVYYKYCAKRIENSATDKLAVSRRAVLFMFGKYGGRVIKNPTISLERLNPNNYKTSAHEEIRLIHIGSFSKRKNQEFSLEVSKELISMGVKCNLTIIGFSVDDSKYDMELYSKVRLLGISECVCFLPKDTDIPRALADSDYMLLPSLREGLPNVALEAQAMGVPCFISNVVTSETNCGLCEFLNLEDGPREWARAILDYRELHGTEKKYVDMTEWDNTRICQEYMNIWTR